MKAHGQRNVWLRLVATGSERRSDTSDTSTGYRRSRARVYARAIRCKPGKASEVSETLRRQLFLAIERGGDCGVFVDRAHDAFVLAKRLDANRARAVYRALRDAERFWVGTSKLGRRLSRAATPFTGARIDLEDYLRTRRAR
jgi:hypothetical protein